MQKKQGRHLRQVVHTALLLMATSQTIITPFSVVQAAEQTVASTYRIKAGPLAQSLNEFAAVAGVSISQPPALVDGVTSRAVNGTYTTRQALDTLLDGTGLEAVETAKGVFKLQKKAITGEKQRVLPEIVAADSADAQNLPEVSVSAKADTETAWSPVKGYLARQSATGTKTDSSILETPVSVQVVTREVMDDQVSVNLKDVYENVSGVQQAGNTLNAQTEVLPIIRGFESPNLMRNGLRATNAGAVDLVNVERVEVLKGPASIMYGALEPGASSTMSPNVLKRTLAIRLSNNSVAMTSVAPQQTLPVP